MRVRLLLKLLKKNRPLLMRKLMRSLLPQTRPLMRKLLLLKQWPIEEKYKSKNGLKPGVKKKQSYMLEP